MRKKKVAIIHAAPVSMKELNELFMEIAPEAEVCNIMDDSLLKEVSAAGHVTPGIVRRMAAYAQQAEAIGADLIVNQCSSLSEAADIAGKMVSRPILNINQAMAEKAVTMGRKIAVVATVASACGPGARMVQASAQAAGKDVSIKNVLVDGALDRLLLGDRDSHNKMVRKAMEEAEKEADVFVLAQGSMTVLLPEISHMRTPVLTSPRLGVVRAKELLAACGGRI